MNNEAEEMVIKDIMLLELKYYYELAMVDILKSIRHDAINEEYKRYKEKEITETDFFKSYLAVYPTTEAKSFVLQYYIALGEYKDYKSAIAKAARLEKIAKAPEWLRG